MKIVDSAGPRYEVPESVFPRPTASDGTRSSNIQFQYTKAPFSFAITRKGTNETLFNTAGFPLVFEPQYLRVKTSLPQNANIYGLGEHTDPFRLPPENTTVSLLTQICGVTESASGSALCGTGMPMVRNSVSNEFID